MSLSGDTYTCTKYTTQKNLRNMLIFWGIDLDFSLILLRKQQWKMFIQRKISTHPTLSVLENGAGLGRL